MEKVSKKNGFNTYTVAVIGMLAAVVFVATYFYIPVPTGIDNTRIHFGNIFCLLCGMLLGGFKGGLAAGIGSMFFDLVDPAYITSAPYTLVFKFLMAYVCGSITNARGADSRNVTRNIIGASAGSLTYLALYLGRSFIRDYFFMRNPIETVMASVGTKFVVSGINGVVAVIAAVILIPVFMAAFERSGFKQRMA